METKTEPTEKTLEQVNQEWNEKYLRLYADFDNYKKRTIKEKEDIKTKTKSDTLESILDLDNDLHYACKAITDEKALEAVKIISGKLSNFLKSQGVEEVQTNQYDEDLHEAISVVDNGSPGSIVDVVSKGYIISGKVVKYPKLIIGK